MSVHWRNRMTPAVLAEWKFYLYLLIFCCFFPLFFLLFFGNFSLISLILKLKYSYYVEEGALWSNKLAWIGKIGFLLCFPKFLFIYGGHKNILFYFSVIGQIRGREVGGGVKPPESKKNHKKKTKNGQNNHRSRGGGRGIGTMTVRPQKNVFVFFFYFNSWCRCVDPGLHGGHRVR